MYVNNDSGDTAIVQEAALHATIDRFRVAVDKNNRVVKLVVELKSMLGV